MMQYRKRLFPSGSAQNSDSATPPKRTLVLPSLLDFPESVLHEIFKHLDILQLSLFCLTSKTSCQHVTDFCKSRDSLPVLFPCMFKIFDTTPLNHLIVGSGSKFGYDPKTARPNFRRLGLLIKRLTCLLPTGERVTFCSDILSFQVPPASNDHAVFRLMAVSVHKLVEGWTDDETYLAATILFSQFNSDQKVSRILSLTYQLGSDSPNEMLVRNFLSSLFVKEVVTSRHADLAREQKKLWLQTLISLVSSDNNLSVISRILLLISTPAKEGILYQGVVQWDDHAEAIPATLAVATSRYDCLISMYNILRFGSLAPLIPEILSNMFQTPEPWLLENVGCVLLLMGQSTTRHYLFYLINQVIERSESCSSCFSRVTTAISGLAVMSARFRWSLTPVFQRLDEVLGRLQTEELRHNLLTSLWETLVNELKDLRLAEGEDWAQEGGIHLFKVIKLLGKRLTEKAYLNNSIASLKQDNINEE